MKTNFPLRGLKSQEILDEKGVYLLHFPAARII